MTKSKQKLVVKIGSSTLVNPEGGINNDRMAHIVAQIAAVRQQGWQVIVVSSGAIACGMFELSMKKRPRHMPTLQAAASVGQCAFIAAWARAFDAYGIKSSSVLLTRRDTADRKSYLHARDTLNRLLELDVVPVVNENDTVSVEQIRFGDNDTLAALVSCLVEAQKCLILSDVEGLYSENPNKSSHATLVPEVHAITPEILSIAGGSGSTVGSGGMQTKISAARVLMAAGIPLVVACGSKDQVIEDVADGRSVGTAFITDCVPHTITPLKLWIALADSSKGKVVVDSGARNALVNLGSSLLAVGIKAVEGKFQANDIVDVAITDETVFARGVVEFSSDAIRLACGSTSQQLACNSLLLRMASRPVIHRDKLFVF